MFFNINIHIYIYIYIYIYMPIKLAIELMLGDLIFLHLAWIVEYTTTDLVWRSHSQIVMVMNSQSVSLAGNWDSMSRSLCIDVLALP